MSIDCVNYRVESAKYNIEISCQENLFNLPAAAETDLKEFRYLFKFNRKYAKLFKLLKSYRSKFLS